MSSIFSSFKNITSDTQWFIKLCIMTVPVFLLMNYFLDANRVFNPHVIPFLIAVLVVYTGCGAFIINRYINNTFPILPDLVGIPELLFHSIFSVLVMAPGLVLCLGTMYLISTNLFLEMKIMMGIYGLVLVFFLPFIFIPLTLYAMNGNIKIRFRTGIFPEDDPPFQGGKTVIGTGQTHFIAETDQFIPEFQSDRKGDIFLFFLVDSLFLFDTIEYIP